MTGLLAIVALGFVLGMRHATDADHVVAVTTLVSHERSVKLAAWLGALWGVGHAVTIALVGGAIIIFNVVVPQRLGLAMEMGVGLMLILLGIVNLASALRARGASACVPAHSHAGAAAAPGLDAGGRRLLRALRPMAIGVVHGLAGSAAVALLILTTIREPRWAFAYLLVYAAGTVAGMVLVTAAIAWPFLHAGRQTASSGRRLQIATGLFSLAFGVALAYRIGYLGGLFSTNPGWMPQ